MVFNCTSTVISVHTLHHKTLFHRRGAYRREAGQPSKANTNIFFFKHRKLINNGFAKNLKKML